MFREKGNKTIPEIADLLQVSYILEGTVQREADNIRINIQLIDAINDDHVFSKQYDRSLSEIFKLQSEIAGQIAKELSFVLTDRQAFTLKEGQTTSIKALEYSQLGRYHLNRRTREDLFTSVKYFRLSINEDPNYALAYAELADSYFILSWYGHIERKTGRDSAVYLALKALELNINLGEAFTVLGVVYNEYDLEYDAALTEFLKAIKTKPNHAPAYQYYAEFLYTAGKGKEAREALNKAIHLDPYSYIVRYASSLLYYNEENYDQALAEIQICQGLINDNLSQVFLAYKIYRKLKNEQAALESFKKMVRITDNWTPEEVDSQYRIGGMDGLLRWWLDAGSLHGRNSKATCHALLGEDEIALDILESSLNEGLLQPFITAQTDFKNIRSHPRFIAIRNKMGLPTL
jgi:tetratricopeptide (TPR) repeat protein